MQLIDRAEISKLSHSARQGYAALLILMACCALYVAYLFGEMTFREYQLNTRYSREGIKAEGLVTGFRFFQATGKNPERHTGYHPNVTFTTPNGPVILKASIGEPLTSAAQQQFWLGREVHVLYLPDQPDRARVLEWPTEFSQSLMLMTAFMFSISMLVLYFARVMWPSTAK
ncbi:DUF3592 domain-containing protein [Polaromonas sp. A23]|uniref:DUF3592 domain-containing protein n=1 Tax=Polaromonas sp. A23 TaxID=1944133 RepID=UPI000986C740|nr:DUF3592 domain-containing protein [Polaromonas sp. A23]OOG39090.1 hypothetical protein B0B52_15885 [Polaromonas sp. A23]